MKHILSLNAHNHSFPVSNGLTCLRDHRQCKDSCGKDDLIGVVKFVNACIIKMDPSPQAEASDQPCVAGRDVI